MKIKVSSALDTGKKRDNNEDAFIFCPDLSNPNWQLKETPSYIHLGEYGALLVVADGMGGQNAGEIASDIAINSIRKALCPSKIENAIKTNATELFLKEIVKEADDAIKQRTNEDADTIGMGTTIVICWISTTKKAHIVWCGDSRCYAYNPSKGLKALTKDHSYVQELIDKGDITEEEAFVHPDSNLITRSLGDPYSDSEPDYISYDIKENDYLLLCSDGLCGYCHDKEIEDIITANYQDITSCRDNLLKLALDAGGYDNICIVLASLIDDNQIEPSHITIVQRLRRRFGLT